MKPIKPEQMRMRATEEAVVTIDAIIGHGPLSRSDVASMVLHAGLEAIRRNGNRFGMPLRFEVAEEIYGLRDAPPKLTPAKK